MRILLTLNEEDVKSLDLLCDKESRTRSNMVALLIRRSVETKTIDFKARLRENVNVPYKVIVGSANDDPFSRYSKCEYFKCASPGLRYKLTSNDSAENPFEKEMVLCSRHLIIAKEKGVDAEEI